ncbi:MAG: cobalamin biosynthesis protein CbiX [Verrucomicrobia bacterium]|jgi:sirohydrochlorin cobaltochelatase|nr:cobalamin biosynthesis protein CbiX [Verrucomicrobiota bacterium]
MSELSQSDQPEQGSRSAADRFSDAALVIIGHGSSTNTESALAVRQHAGELRRRRLFGEVREAFWKQEPRLGTVAQQTTQPRVFFVPLFISEGYFTEEAIPTELGFRTSEDLTFERVRKHGNQLWHYTGPVGTHESMTAIILARARSVIEKHPFPRAPKPEQTALLIAGHGTGRNVRSRKAIEDQVLAIRSLGMYAEVHAIFMEEAPRIGDAFTLTQARNLVVVPFFISDGLHTQEDIPMLLGEPERFVRDRMAQNQPTWRNPTERKGKMVWYGQSVGSEPGIADVILERVRQVAGPDRHPATGTGRDLPEA